MFEQSGKVVPVFNDKHLSWNWDEAKWMYNQSREMGFPLMAGSSIPTCYRNPEIDLDTDSPLRRGVVATYGGKDWNGFHSLEMLQCLAERRVGGETGIASVQCIEGPEVWKWTDRNPWSGELLEAAMDIFPEEDDSNRTYENRRPGNVRDNAKTPILFIVNYRDGFQGAVYHLNGHLRRGHCFAGEVRGMARPFATLSWHCYINGQYDGANIFVHHIQDLVINGKEPYPVERTLLTSGTLTNLCQSNWENGVFSRVGRVIETPFLDMTYTAPSESQFNTGPRPPELYLDMKI
ncbi:hypothetical protein ACFL1R_10155 [Candidatus Latescibacterota bacterium]